MNSASGLPTKPISQEKTWKQLGLIKQVYQAYTVLQKQADGSIDKALGIVADAARGERTQAFHAANPALAPSFSCFSVPCLHPWKCPGALPQAADAILAALTKLCHHQVRPSAHPLKQPA